VIFVNSDILHLLSSDSFLQWNNFKQFTAKTS